MPDPNLLERLAAAIVILDAGDPIAAWSSCADAAPEIRNLPSMVDRAIGIGRLGIVAAAVGDPFTAVVCREEALLLAGRTGGAEPGSPLGLVLARLEGVCCTLDHHPTLA